MSGGLHGTSFVAGAFYGVRAVETADQTITTGTPTLVTFDDTDADTSDYHSATVNTSRLTVPPALGGYYCVYVSVRPDDAVGNWYAHLKLLKNGSLVEGCEDIITFSGTGTQYRRLKIVDTILLVPGDYVESRFEHNKGSNMLIRHSFSAGSFGMYRVGT